MTVAKVRSSLLFRYLQATLQNPFNCVMDAGTARMLDRHFLLVGTFAASTVAAHGFTFNISVKTIRESTFNDNNNQSRYFTANNSNARKRQLSDYATVGNT